MNRVNVEYFGQDPKILKAISFARNVAVIKAPVLMVGELGTGKRTLCRFIHENSSRNEKPFLVVDCSADKEEVENKILGYREGDGNFTRGVLEQGNGGSVVFANIDCLEENFQKRLHQIFSELVDYDIDVRIFATTSKNLSKLVGSGRFHRSLFNIVSGTQIYLTPLRERLEDIKFLTELFLKKYSQELECECPKVSDNGWDKLLGHYWTQNISELSSVMESSVDRAENGILQTDHIAIGENRTITAISDTDEDGMKLMSLREAEKLLIKKALVHTSENRTQAAKILGVSIRTLRNKINEYRNDGSNYFMNLR